MTTTAAAVIAALVARGVTVATAESLTGGQLCAVLTEVPGASACVRGAVVSYATDVKASLLDVDPQLLADRGPVDPTVAAQMAVGVCRRLDATYGVACTGVAGPAPQAGQPPGVVYLAVHDAARGTTTGSALRLSGDRMAVRAATVDAALAALLAVAERSDAGVSGREEVPHRDG
ncbi:MAG: nicotinamide-nucleotide amidohydrolase family protein [Actinomycetota bacterium]|nr:MAG: nicotinamide-nucleotide amidohydrolase family protein [Actinomycetota bacterium]